MGANTSILNQILKLGSRSTPMSPIFGFLHGGPRDCCFVPDQVTRPEKNGVVDGVDCPSVNGNIAHDGGSCAEGVAVAFRV